jgi:hypothetical protein
MLKKLLIPIGAFVLSSALVSAYLYWFSVHENPAYESIMPTFPAPAELRPVKLPGFHYVHPRLPAPTSEDIQKLQAHNPGYFKQHLRKAKGGRGNLYSSILMAFVEPGSQDLDTLHDRLLNLDPGYRGNNTGTIALGYDWLYEQWTPAQRDILRVKVTTSCNRNIDIIRNRRLSPYNVYLYNHPLQELMACALAIYGEGSEEELVMRFTHDYWKNRVLPVWRQVMGNNGGWHEGGEYIGIGIGKAIYQLPAMWRSATGEDLFSKEPGIKGFLDFLVYRTRPDGTHFRWGDAAAFNKMSYDRLALALEYRHQAAYSLRYKPKSSPTSWPWGQLADPDFYNPSATNKLPLIKYLDGIGMTIARSDWSPDATYVTFKAGDNYWSHSHLDQGAFTIYKGGALAIDSGLYNQYGSEHHMNYTYQTIAHNTITVTDPLDIVPAPGKKDSRYIANDGGQRRIGSGWGIEPAPLDHNEWQRNYETYHTGRIHKFYSDKRFVIVIADITPAYTNRLSGRGTFTNRTNRVNRFWRTFAYDIKEDLIFVFDSIKSTQPEFKKRWLLHSIERPQKTPYGFELQISPNIKPLRTGGKLSGHVIYPADYSTSIIGGEDYEFFVDKKNYTNNGRIYEVIDKKSAAEPGAWRIEISPDIQNLTDRFLVAMHPESSGTPTNYIHIEPALKPGFYGAIVNGMSETITWWFRSDASEVVVEQDGERILTIKPPASTAVSD